MNLSDVAIQLGVLGAVAAGIATREPRAGQAGNGEPVRDKGLGLPRGNAGENQATGPGFMP
jgi:hypothetical protein